MRFKFNLISMLLALLFGQSAYAATLSVSFDGAGPMNNRYNPGATVTVTLVGTTVPYSPNGIAPIDTAQSIDVRIVGAGFSGVSAETGTGGTCITATGCLLGAAYQVGGTQGSTIGGNFIAFSQIAGLAAGPLTNNMTVGVPFHTGESSLSAVFTTTAGAPGTYPIMLADVGVGFFDVSGSQQIGSYTVVPEPTTAALMGLGLLGLAFAGRRR